MTELTALWLPILVSAVIVFVASSVIHMGPLWHKGDYPPMPREAEVMDALRPFNLPPGGYMFPRAASMADMRSPEFLEKHKRGPVALMTVFPSGEMGMGAQLTQWFVFALVVGLFGAYIAGQALPPGAPYLRVFQFVGATTFIAYSVALWEMSIWYRRAWSMSIKATVDGLIYACLTAGTFGWLWPS
jgi:hypothetical protein